MHSIRISGDYLGVLFINNDDDDDDNDDDDGNELVVWNWKTGVKDLVSEYLHLLLQFAFRATFFSDNHIGRYDILRFPRRSFCFGVCVDITTPGL